MRDRYIRIFRSIGEKFQIVMEFEDENERDRSDVRLADNRDRGQALEQIDFDIEEDETVDAGVSLAKHFRKKARVRGDGVETIDGEPDVGNIGARILKARYRRREIVGGE